MAKPKKPTRKDEKKSHRKNSLRDVIKQSNEALPKATAPPEKFSRKNGGK